MGLGQRVRRMVAAGRRRRQFSTGATLDELIALAIAGKLGGEEISRQQALAVPAFQRGRNLLCSISTLPLVQLDPYGQPGRNPFLDQIDPDVPNVVTIAQTVEDLICDGISWWRVTARGFDQFPTHAEHLDFARVSLEPPAPGLQSPLPGEYDPRNAVVYVDGKPVGARDIIRFDSPNPAALQHADGIRLAILVQKLASLYADDPRPLDYFELSDNAAEPDEPEVKKFLEKWRAARRKRSTAWIPPWAKYNTVTAPSPAELQLVELKKQATLEIANQLGVDPEDLGVSTTSRTYQNSTDRRQSRINDVNSPYMLAITQRLSMGDVTRQRYRVVFDLDDYLRADPTTRVAYYAAMNALRDEHGRPALSVDEIRVEERLMPLPELPATPPPAAPPVPETEPGAPPANDPAAGELVAARHSLVTFGRRQRARLRRMEAAGARSAQEELQPVAQFMAPFSRRSFAVDQQARTVEGIVLPYGDDQVADFGWFGSFRFAPGALQFAAGQGSRVKLLQNHDVNQLLGHMVYSEDRSEGMFARFSVAPGPAGDQALALAAHGSLDGFSVGVDFDEEADTIPDPSNRGTLLVRRAYWRETSLTPMPAFDDARVSKVAAARNRKGAAVPDTDPVTEPTEETQPEGTPAASNTIQLTAEARARLLNQPALVDAMFAQMMAPQQAQPQPAERVNLSAEQMRVLMSQPRGSELVAAILGVPLQPQQQQEQPTVVDPTRRTAATRVSAQVQEPAPYRFNARGQLVKGTHEFSADLIAFEKQGDQAAYDRALSFIRKQFADDPIATSDVSDLFPTLVVNRYVDERPFAYPLYTRVGRGAPPNGIQPFAWPKFSSSGITVTDHTQGTDPDSTDYQTDVQSVTPAARSGRVQIPREIWDVGGTPALSQLIWAKAMRAWGEKREAVIDAVLDAATPTSLGTFTAGGGTGKITLTQELEKFLAALNFVRGGFRFEFIAAQVDLFGDLAGAVDSTGRKIYPMITPTNANGQALARWNSMNVGGVDVVPNIAGDATGSVAASSYLLDPSAVDAWDSGPLRIDFTAKSLSYVEIGIWGYMAAAINDLAGVREASYDPVA